MSTAKSEKSLRRNVICAIAACVAGAAAIAVSSQAAAQAAADADKSGAPPVAQLQKVTVKAVARFGFDQSSLRLEDGTRIMGDLSKMGDVTWQQVVATGYTDSQGADDYNVKLSQRRADAVKRYLMSKGVDGNMVRTVGKGEADPIADNSSDSGRAQNRRTEIEFVGVKTASR